MPARIALAYALSAIALSTGPAVASEPVPRTIEACVIGGVFTDARYTYRVQVVGGGEWRRVDLSAFEGMTLRIRGYLLPGDSFTLRAMEIVADTCIQRPR